ncbi:hypothetical protein GGI07_000724 [Coemansia sp. Benny D115]|nr:hypothetical protein GGI07_000724 [Coemansia sp. Benny D115]
MSKFTGKLGVLHDAYQRVVSAWPVDKLRPTHCYKTVLKQQMNKKFDRLGSLHGEKLAIEYAQAEKELAALKNLASNKYRTQYKVSEAISDPISRKGYYIQLIASIDEAIKSNKKTGLRVD